MKVLRLILGDQLNINISSLADLDPYEDTILMAEVYQETQYVKHHKKKIAFIFSAMRHFYEELKIRNYPIIYFAFSRHSGIQTFTDAIKETLTQKKIDKIIVTFPGEYRVLEEIKGWETKFNLPVEIRPDQRFLADLEEFKGWQDQYKVPRMEYFYRKMRVKHNILIKNGQPVGGQWNFDQENRQSFIQVNPIETDPLFKPDLITKSVLTLVNETFTDHFGDTLPFYFAVTREQALLVLKDFIDHKLTLFGQYQDMMVQNQPFLFHAKISFYLNCGLLLPMECIQVAETAYYEKKLPLNAVEGFIRQILGWREYVRGIYWSKMPGYEQNNALEAKRLLPAFFWTGETAMNCLKQVILQTKQYAYAHHIQRLMVIGNFALLTGLEPKAVAEWFLIVYADAFEWVELPNVIGMILYADGGYLASKPYAASGAYINKMSNYCKSCHYKVKLKVGPEACPFNYLYWHFLSTHSELANNPRLSVIYKRISEMPLEQLNAIKQSSENFLNYQLIS